MILTTAAELAGSGDAVARDPEGRVVFVEGAAPSERVEARIVEKKKRFARARVLRVLEPSPERVEPRCPHFGTCGGCLLQHVAPAAQTRSKQASLRDALIRIGKIDLAEVRFEPAWTGAPYGYRARARFHLGPNGELGFRRLGSHAIVDLSVCPILDPALERARALLRAHAPKGPFELEAIAFGGRAQVSLPLELASLAMVEGEIELAVDPQPIDAGGLLLAPGVFAQASVAGNAALVEAVIAALGPGPFERILELYSGSGNFTRALARVARKVTAVEGSSAAVSLARRTAAPNVELRELPVERALEGAVDAVVVDPPRTGLSDQMPAGIAALSPRKLVYVSCDPATFARDAGRLAALGLGLRSVRLFDLYPQTPHAEVLGLFTR